MAGLWYQMVMNGTRFGLYSKVLDSGLISRKDGSVSPLGCVAAGAGVGIIGGFLGSPLYLVSSTIVCCSIYILEYIFCIW